MIFINSGAYLRIFSLVLSSHLVLFAQDKNAVNEGDFNTVECGTYDILGMLLPVYNRSDSYGAADLYVTFRDKHDNWTPVVNLGDKINTKRVESAARISPDGRYIFLTGLYITHNWGNESLSYSDILNYFTRPGYGKADIYWISSKIIEPFKPVYLK